MNSVAITAPRPLRVRRAVVAALVLAVIAGLVWMHALTASHHAAGPATHGHAAARVPCDGHESEPCPPVRSDHRGSVCRSGAVAPGYTVPAPQPAAAYAGEPTRQVMSAVTVATEAGDGTGCGPPSLTMLSISRI